jgi:iron(III) transport system substrate-binding protein
MSLIKGGKNPEMARKWYEFALSPAGQNLAARAKSYQVPSNMASTTPPQAPKLSEMKLIDYDFAKYGASAERKRLIERWEKEVGSLPK